MTTETIDTRFSLGTWLRRLGAITFVGAGALFLFEGVADAAALRRELMWTTVTLALSFSGIFVARAARDAAGARVWLGLAAATIPTHFAQVGGQLWGYRVEGTESFGGVALGCALLVLLAPPLSIGISALVRGRGVLLTALLFALSCPLLAPTRDGDAIAAIVVAEVLVLLGLELGSFRHDPRMMTLEGRAARAMLLLPPSILLLRSAFHPATSAWAAALVATPSIVLLALPHVTPARGPLARVFSSLAVIGIAVAVVLFCGGVPWVGLLLSVVGLLGTAAALEEPKIFAYVGTGAFALTVAVLTTSASAPNAALIVPVGVLHVLAAHRLRSLPMLVVSLVATTVGVVGQLAPSVALPTHDRWIGVAVVAMALLLSATIIERYHGRLERAWSQLVSRFRIEDAPVAAASVVVPEAPAATEIYR